MKRSALLCAVVLLYPFASIPANAQMGGDFFKRLTIAKAFHPVVGKGAQYQVTRKELKSGQPTLMEMGVTSKEMVDGGEGFWMQFVSTGEKNQTIIGKMLFSSGDAPTVRRMIILPPGQTQAVEMPINVNEASKDKLDENFAEWKAAGTETVTVPAGTFSCQHWRNEKRNADLWTSDKITPFGAVKLVDPNQTMMLVKVLDAVPDRITGPVRKFDIQEMMRKAQQERQKP